MLRSAVRNRLIAYNPCEDIRVPKRRKQDHDEQVVARDVFRRTSCCPAVPDRYRGLVAVAGGAGLRWGEAAGLCADAVDLDAGRLRVIRTVVEVAGHTRFKGYPKSTAGRRSSRCPGWLVDILREHTERYGYGEADLLFGTRSGAPIDGRCSGPGSGGRRWSGPACSARSRGMARMGRGVDRRRTSGEPSGSRPKTQPSSRWHVGTPADCAITI